MIGISENTERVSGQLSKSLSVLSRETHLDAQLDAEVNGVTFHVFVDGDSAIVSFASFSDALSLYQMYAGFICEANNHDGLFMSILKKLNITLYLQNRHFGIMGPRAGSVVSRLFSLATVMLRKNKR